MEVRVLIRYRKRVRFQVDPAFTHSQDDLSHLPVPLSGLSQQVPGP
jgi:hypothetical protein